MKKLLVILTLFATFLGVTLGKTVYVNANYPTDGNGTSWSSPYTNLQTAVTASIAGDLILVTNGVYAPITTGNKAITIRSVEGYTNTIIDGVGTTRCATLETGVVLDGFTTRNGASTDGGGTYGGSVLNSVIDNCTASNRGGGIFGATMVSNCIVANNIARSPADGVVGGGIHGNGRTVVMDSLISGNIATNTYAQAGGVGHATVYRCRIENNMARLGGGTYRCDVYDNSTIVSNIATYAGGGVGTYSANTHKIHDSVIEYNSTIAAYGGGTLNMYVSNCIVRGNTANGYGGGTYGGTLTGCTISGNTASLCGGLLGGTAYSSSIVGNTATNSAGSAYSVLYNCKVVGNVARTAGGALERGAYYNCTFYGNAAPDYAVGHANGHASQPSFYNCTIYGNVNTGPNIRQLQVPSGGIFYCSSIDSVDKLRNGINTPTVFPIYGNPLFTDPANDDFTLLPTSPCINKGANQYVTTPTDLAGSPRIKDWRVDMGAYESQSTRFVKTPNALYPMGTKDVYRWTPLELRPIAWYKAENAATDSIGAYNGTWSGSPAYTTGKIGGGFALNGTASISIGTTAVYRATSVAMWVYVAVLPNAGRQHFGALNKVGFRTGGVGNKLNWNVWNQDGTRYELPPVSDTTVGDWTHYCGTWDGSASTVYINGAYSASWSAPGTSLGSLSSALVIGPSNTGNIIDDVLIFNRALTADEIKKLYDETVKQNGEPW